MVISRTLRLLTVTLLKRVIAGATDRFSDAYQEGSLIEGKRIVVVLPAYNAAATLRRTYEEIPKGIVDDVLLVDDASKDETLKTARELGIPALSHLVNRGYGANQKTCYQNALNRDGDVFIMLHPDYQYSPKLIPAMASMATSGEFDVVLGSRIIGGGTLGGGMPRYKYYANRALTLFENILLWAKVSEYHTGYRAMTREVLETLPLAENSDDFVFDNEFLAQVLFFGFRIGEISCPTRYFAEASSINFRRSVVYGLGVLRTSLMFRLQKWGLASFRIFDSNGRRLTSESVDYLSERGTDETRAPTGG